MATDVKTQLTEKGKNFVAYPLIVDESTNVTDRAQLAIFQREVDRKLCVKEEVMGPQQ